MVLRRGGSPLRDEHQRRIHLRVAELQRRRVGGHAVRPFDLGEERTNRNSPQKDGNTTRRNILHPHPNKFMISTYDETKRRTAGKVHAA